MEDSVTRNNKFDLSYTTSKGLIDSHLNNNKEMAQNNYSKTPKTASVRPSFKKD